MKIKDVMTKAPITCTPDTNIAAAAERMLKGDCGVLPVVAADGTLAGIVTDRDLFIALATRDKLASQLTVGEVARTTVFSCGVDTDIVTALGIMKRHYVRRLPVLDEDGTVVGIVSMNDIVLAAGRRKAVHNEDAVETLQAICAHRLPSTSVAA